MHVRILPTCYCYTSEGIRHTKLSERIAIKVNFSISYTTVCQSDCELFHITISPSKDSYFSELDLIQFVTLFGSKQERVKRKEGDGFLIKIGDAQAVPIPELVNRYSENKSGYQQLGSGIVQVDLSKFESEQEIDFKTFFETHLSDKKCLLRGQTELFSKTLCGIILGIFDFERMDEEEIADTILPIIPNNQSFVVMSRGMLLKISNNKSFMQAINTNLIVSPYLLISNVALVYNEYLLEQAQEILQESECKTSKIATLEKHLSTLRTMLNMHYLEDLFQYPSEKDIVEVGLQQRGIANLHKHIAKRIDLIADTIARMKSTRSRLSQALLDAVLGIIATAQLVNLYRWFSEAESTETMVTVTIFLSVALIIFSLSLSRNKK